jgi:hypothetical protein
MMCAGKIIARLVLTADFDGGFEFEKDRLVDEDFPSFHAEGLDLVFLKLNKLSGSVTSNCICLSSQILCCIIQE